MRNNERIRSAIKESNLHYWQIAEKLGIHEGTFSRKLRHELTDEEKEKIFGIINELKGALQ